MICIRLVTCCTRTGSNVTRSLKMWGMVLGSERILFTVGSTLMIRDLLDRILGIYPYCIYLATSNSEAPGEDNDWCHYLLQQPPSLHVLAQTYL